MSRSLRRRRAREPFLAKTSRMTVVRADGTTHLLRAVAIHHLSGEPLGYVAVCCTNCAAACAYLASLA